MPIRILLDTNIFDKLSEDADSTSLLNLLSDENSIEIIIPYAVIAELIESPFGGIPNWLNVKEELDSVSVLPFKIGTSRLGDGEAYSAHLGKSKKFDDAKVVDAVSSYSVDIFVSEDRRCLHRAKEAVSECSCFSYSELIEHLRMLVKS